MNIFIDTWGFKAMIDKRDSKHHEVSEYVKDIWEKNLQLFTSDYILDKTITLLSSRLGYYYIKIFIDTFLDDAEETYIKILWVGKDLFKKALIKKIKFADKRDISFTDCTTMVLMEENKINEIITADRHFEFMGFSTPYIK